MKYRNTLVITVIIVCSLLASLTVNAGRAAANESSPRIVNIINFIRLLEPRSEKITEEVLYNTVVSQIEIMQEYGLKGTFLLQYDALMDARYQKLLKALPKDSFEIGVWWEIPQPLVEDTGYTWRGRYPWDWHANVGFATGYTPVEREKLVDTCMAAFKNIFGYYPVSVGSWFIDAHTLNYMAERYGIIASCNCKDQIGTDGYTMWGGYWNQGFYPSKKNAYMPAQNAESQIPVPIFRMLGSDPIHQYDAGLGGNRQHVVSLEPVYEGGGGSERWCRWYFDSFINGAAMAYGYVQAGQENSFTWDGMKQGFEIQVPMIADMLKDGKVAVQTLAETGKWFADKYPVTPPTSVTVLNDHASSDRKTVWFNSRFYRANILWDKGTMRFRDIHLFDETMASDYLTKKGTSTQCRYETLPFVDGFRWSSEKNIAGLRLKTADGNEVKGGTPEVDDSVEGKLTVRWATESPKGAVVLTFEERSLDIRGEGGMKDNWYFELTGDLSAELPFDRIESRKVSATFMNHPYTVTASQGTFAKEKTAVMRLMPEGGSIRLDFSVR